jgi:hypothetical protein
MTKHAKPPDGNLRKILWGQSYDHYFCVQNTSHVIPEFQWMYQIGETGLWSSNRKSDDYELHPWWHSTSIRARRRTTDVLCKSGKYTTHIFEYRSLLFSIPHSSWCSFDVDKNTINIILVHECAVAMPVTVHKQYWIFIAYFCTL